MDMSLYNVTLNMRLLLQKPSNKFLSQAPILNKLLKDNGVNNIFINSDQNAGYIKKLVKLFDGPFNIIIECDLDNYRRLGDELEMPSGNIQLMPVFYLEDGIKKFRSLMKAVTERRLSNFISIKTKNKNNTHKLTARMIMNIIKEVKEKHIKFYWDCGLLPCNLKEEEFGYFIQKDSLLRSFCPSLLSMDTNFDMYFCEDIKKNTGKVNLLKCSSLPEVLNKFAQILIPYASIGIYNKCTKCRYFPRICSGGCKAVIMNSFKN